MEGLKTPNIIQVLSFKLGEDEYGMDIRNITTIIENNLPITRVPGVPPYIKGVINLRGDIVPVLELRRKLNLQPVEDTEDTKIIVVDIDDMTVGIKVDRVLEVVQLDKECIEEVSGIGDENSRDYFSGLGRIKDRVIILMDIEKVIRI
ncbi:MAG: purine-binding chemotaxis protein CheW [Firmicutes bacterium]|nr:purine-binding chemotaxis protein CheW [Bacillota bacterium]